MDRLPFELVVAILSFIPALSTTWLSLQRVCKSFYHASNDRHVLLHLAKPYTSLLHANGFTPAERTQYPDKILATLKYYAMTRKVELRRLDTTNTPVIFDEGDPRELFSNLRKLPADIWSYYGVEIASGRKVSELLSCNC